MWTLGGNECTLTDYRGIPGNGLLFNSLSVLIKLCIPACAMVLSGFRCKSSKKSLPLQAVVVWEVLNLRKRFYRKVSTQVRKCHLIRSEGVLRFTMYDVRCTIDFHSRWSFKQCIECFIRGDVGTWWREDVGTWGREEKNPQKKSTKWREKSLIG